MGAEHVVEGLARRAAPLPASYARWYAARSQGDLYVVEPIGELLRSDDDHFPSWTCASARVVGVVERRVRLDRRDRREMLRLWKRADRLAEGVER